MTYQQEREEFVAAMAREFPELGIGAVRAKAERIIRDANRVQSHAVKLCNREVTAREVKGAERAEERIRAEFGYPVPYGDACFEFSGDPRGACVKVKFCYVPGNSFRGDGFYCVPTRRY